MPKTEPATPEQASALLRLEERLSDPASWLPAMAWRQPEFKPYVPSRFAVSVWSARTRKLSRILAVLPAPVQAALGDRHWRQQWSGPYFDATTEKARAIAKALAGAGPTRKGGAFHLNYQFEIPGGSGEMVVIGFKPYLPHGETTCSACG